MRPKKEEDIKNKADLEDELKKKLARPTTIDYTEIDQHLFSILNDGMYA